MKGHSWVCWWHGWLCRKRGFLHLGLLLASLMDLVESPQERTAMGDQENTDRGGPLRMLRISSIRAKKFPSNGRRCQHLLFGQETGNSAQITRLMTSDTVVLCSNVSPWHGHWVGEVGCWQALALSARPRGARCWGCAFAECRRHISCFWSCQSQEIGSVDSEATGGIKWSVLCGRQGADSQSTPEIVLTLSRITWERSEEEWSFCRGAEGTKYFSALWMWPGEMRASWGMFSTFVSYTYVQYLEGARKPC